MGKLALLAVVLGAAVLTARQHSDQDVSLRAAQSAAYGDTYAVLARSSALAGFARVEQALSRSFADVAVAGAFEGGTYEADAVVAGGQAQVTTVGTFPRPGAADVTFRIRALVAPAGGAGPAELPPFLSYSVMAGAGVRMSGTADVSSGVSDGTFTPSLHTNGDLRVESGDARVSGFGSYAGTVSGHYHKTFTPPYNPDGLAPVQRTGPVELPTVDADAIAGTYRTVVDLYPPYPGAPAFSAAKRTVRGGTRDSPVVYRVHGDVKVDKVHVDGYAVFIVDGDVTISGKVTSSGGLSAEGGPESSLAIYTEGAVTMKGNSSVQAQLFTQGGLRYEGKVNIYGSLATHGTLDMGGTFSVHGVPASPSLSTAWAEGTAGLAVVAYAEF